MNKEERAEYHRQYRATHKAELTEYNRTGLRYQRQLCRRKHRRFKPYVWLKQGLRKQGFEPQIHHEWIPDTPEYTGIALVEADAHSHNIINPLTILEGKIKISGVIE